MDPKQAKSIFLHAVEHCAPAEWPSYLDQACRADTNLRHGVELLLAAHRENVDLADQGRAALNEALPTIEQPLAHRVGTTIGRYKLLQVIGEGGMGVVYMAEQTEPVERRVALKIIKPGMDSEQVIARFEAERQALAMMDHPNIAKVLDAGTTETGRPYFVMELVKGVAITKYCDEKRLSVRQRLELMIPVCQAIQHAHQKGIIHRDIKPTNVLVAQFDGHPVPKVIDFGVAKATAQKLTERTMFTELGQVVGTVEYMSPEQAELNQLDIDTRSDVYSLGVLLYELLTGCTPFDKQKLRTIAFHEVLRIIREEEPPKPSTRLSTIETLPSIAANRSVEPARLSHAIRGELDWMVMKALEKDRTRRYESANSLAQDIERYLSDEPVVACPPSVAYRFRKFAKKYRAAFTTAVLLAASLLLGTAISIWQAVRATQAESRAIATQADLRETLYAAHINLAHNGWETNNLGRMEYFLAQVEPKPGETDLRHFEWHYLQRLIHSELLLIPGHARRVRSVAYSLNGKYLASAADDQEVKVWDATTGEKLHSLQSGADDPRYYPDGQRMGDGIERPRNRVEVVAFSPDETRLASGPTVWDARTGLKLYTVQGHGWIKAFSPDGKRLAGSGYRGGPGNWASHVVVWDAFTGKELRALKGHIVTLKGHTDHIEGVAFSPDGKRLASASHDNTVIVWDALTGDPLFTYRGHTGWVAAVAFSPDGKHVASGSSDHTVQVWDVETRQVLHVLAGGYRVWGVAYSLDGKRLASGSEDGSIKIWDTETGAELLGLDRQGNIQSVAFSPDGQRLAGGTTSGRVKVWDAHRVRRANITVKGGADAVFGVSFSPDGKRMASGGGTFDKDKIFQGGDVKIWEADATPCAETGKNLLVLKEHTLGVWSVAYSPDGKRLASGSVDKTIRIWDAETGKSLDTLTGHTGPVRTVIFSPDGRQLASAADDRTVKVWDLESGNPPLTLSGNSTSGVWMATKGLAFSPDGRRLAGGSDESVTIWDVASGNVFSTIQPVPAISLLGLAFSPDGRYLARTMDDRVTIWDSQAKRDVQELAGQKGPLIALAYSPDGKRLASTSIDGTVKMWNPQTGHELLTLTGHTDRVCHVAFSPDGHRLATNGQDGTVRIWDARPLITDD